MVACFFIGALLPSLETLQQLGTTTTADWITGWDNFPDEGFKLLYISSLLSSGRGLYLFSMQFLMVSVGLILASHLSLVTQELPKSHAIFGIITSIVGFITFILEIVTFQVGGGIGIALLISLILWGVILMPIWTIWLGVELRRLKSEQRRDALSGVSVELNEGIPR